MIVPASAGGPTDAIGRIMAEHMGHSLGQTIVVENASGAGGSIAVGRVARAAPDGYVIGVGHWGHYVVNGAIYSLQYDLRKDFEPVSLIATGPLVMAAKKSIPANDLKELVGWIKANPSKASAGTGGVGTPAHIGAVFFQNLTGTQFQLVPYRGTGPAMLGLVAGDIDLMAINHDAKAALQKQFGASFDLGILWIGIFAVLLLTNFTVFCLSIRRLFS